MEKFLIITPMGLEACVVKEIGLKHPDFAQNTQFHITDGMGQVAFEASLQALDLNRSLHTPSRILLRLLERKCRDLPRLFKLIRKFNWRPYLITQNVNFKVSCHKSRLMHTGRIEETAKEALGDYFQANALPKKVIDKNQDKTQTIYIRISEDTLQMSMDTSGDRLHKRGNNSFRGKAAIRENIASCLLLELTETLDWSQFQLIDPMCGSGTFIKEAQSFWQVNDQRNFAYEHIDENMPALSLTSNHSFNSYCARDNDELIIKSLNEDWAQLEDLFNITETTSTPQNSIVISNPPYGKRVKISGKKGVFFKQIFESIEHKYAPQRIGLIVPSDIEQSIFNQYSNYRLLKNIRFFNSGIWVKFLVWEHIDSHT